MQKRRIVTIISTAVAFIALEAAAVAVLHFNNELQRGWFSAAGHSAMALLWGGGQKIGDYFHLKTLNDSLAAANFRLSRQIDRYRLAEDRLRLHADTAKADAKSDANETHESGCTRDAYGRFSFLPADIVKISNNRQHNYIIIDKGREDGVLEGAGIISGKGVVGIVEATSAHYSFCISFLNYNMSVSARLGREGPVGTMNWDGMRKATLHEIPHHIFTEPGDTVYTSGFSSIFPKDIPLGVTAGTSLKDGATYDLEVEMFEDFSRLRYVTVVNNLDSEEIGTLEKEGGK